MEKMVKSLEAPLVVITFILISSHNIKATNWPQLNQIVSGCNVTFEVSIDPNFWLTDPGSSTGLFYRLEGGPLGSYFWSETIYKPNLKTTISKTLSLPSGNFELICYQQRKGGPIQTKSFQVTGAGGCGGTFPVKLPPLSLIALTPSWNPFTNSYYSTPSVSQETDDNPISNTPSDPWFFLSLSLSALGQSGVSGVEIDYDETVLDFGGAVINDFCDPIQWNYTHIMNDVNTGLLRLPLVGTQPTNGEVNMHLIFKTKTSVPIFKEKIYFFYGDLFNSYPILDIDTLEVLIKRGPHDPNSLDVDKELLCPCNCNETLNYQVNFQNKGSNFADEVEIRWIPNAYLDAGSINLATQNTTLHGAPVSYLNGSFHIAPIRLPGTTQGNSLTGDFYEYWQTEDNFRFEIDKTDCLSAGTVIQPQVGITFISIDYNADPVVFPFGEKVREQEILTNLEKTEIINPISKDKPCEKNCTTCSGCKMKKKKCWLFRLFAKK